jgi:hypothetical protein
MAFATTHWSIVLEAQGESPAARKALDILCRTYGRTLYGFVRWQGLTQEEAQDLVQEFFAADGQPLPNTNRHWPTNEDREQGLRQLRRKNLRRRAARTLPGLCF